MNPKPPSTTSPAKRAASADAIVDRLFQRLGASYGKHWLDMWAGVPMGQVKATWADALAQFQPATIAEALNDLGKFPPTLPEFVDLCKQRRKPDAPQLAIVGPKQPAPEGTFRRIRDILNGRDDAT